MSVKSENSVAWAISMLNDAETAEEVQVILKTSARAAVQAQGATVVELDGDQCYYADEDAMSPLWKGERFPLTSCISGWAMLHRETVVIPDIWLDERVPQDAYRPTFVRSLVMVPILVGNGYPIGAVGAYWSYPHHAADHEAAALEGLAAGAARALQRILALPDNATSVGHTGVGIG
ncbi:GAF domain-containing protein [Actinomycetes bacterium KLBMP 9797]